MEAHLPSNMGGTQAVPSSHTPPAHMLQEFIGTGSRDVHQHVPDENRKLAFDFKNCVNWPFNV